MNDRSVRHEIQELDTGIPPSSRRDDAGARPPPTDLDSLREENVRLKEESARATTGMERARATAARALATAELANRAKTQFLSTMSHEIRTPINAVLGYVDLLEAGTSGGLNDQQRSHLARVRACAIQLTEIVSTILDLAWAGSGEMEVTRLDADVGDPLQTAITLAMPEAERRGVSLTQDRFRPDLHYVGDPARVRQIVLNLLANAIKFTLTGGHITLSAESRSADADDAPSAANPWTIITIRDSGIGIAHAQLDAVFEPFVQVDMSHTRTHGGSGLGLTISRRYARLMGGDITVDSVQGTGSAFTLWLPAGAAIRPVALPVPETTVPGSAKHANPGTHSRKARPRRDD